MKDLKLEIQAQNSLKAFAKIVLAQILPQLVPFIGKKVFTASGDKTKTFQSAYLLHIDLGKAQPEPIEGMTVKAHYCYLTSQYGKLDLRIGVCLNGGSHEAKPRSTAFCKYEDRQISLGDMKDGQTLDNLIDLDKIIEAYGLDVVLDFDNELAQIKHYKYLLKQAELAKDKINVANEFYKYID